MESMHSIYLPRPEAPSPWRVEVLGAGFASILPGQEYPPRKHRADHFFNWEEGRSLAEFQAILIAEGKGTIETELTEAITIEAPCLFILYPGIWHRYQPDEKTGWREYWVAFDGDYPRELQNQGILTPTEPIHKVSHNENLLAQFQLVLKETQSEAFGFRRISATAIMQILALATSLPGRAEEESQPMRSIIRRACFLMRERADTDLSPESLAAELNVGYTYFRRLFKKYTGISPKRYHSQLRLIRAKSLLKETNLSISEIATALSFDNPFHLSSWFKKQVGVAPRDWR